MMRFSTDHYFQIGHAHYTAGKPCQDHALSRSSGQIACAIVSDGCSTGGNTDVGSRILTFGTLQAIRDHAKASSGSLETAAISITARQQQLIGAVRPMIGLERGDMLATCIYAYFTQSGGLIHVQGDGVIGLKYRDGDVLMRRYEWADNVPFYPSYEGRDLEAFIERHGKDLHATRLDEQIVCRKTNGTNTETSASHTVQEGIRGISLEIPPHQLVGLEFVAVFTDGVTQIENVDWRDATMEFLAFKNNAGEFAKRRMIRGVKDMQQRGKGPIDDISYAVIQIEPDEGRIENESSSQ
jgi:hypothetical protein